MSWKLTLEEINEYKKAFTYFDKDFDGKISSDDLGVLMRSLGQNFSNQDLKEITDGIYKKNGNNIVELHEFLNLMADNRKVKEDETELIRAFQYFDRDNSGTLDFDELKHVLTTVSEKLSPEETQELIKYSYLENRRLVYKDLVKMILPKEN
jgi:Ca2+-binding EF-hand superfamily protein